MILKDTGYTQQMKDTWENMFGVWDTHLENDGAIENIRVIIGDEINFSKTINGKVVETITFPRNAHWFGSWLSLGGNFYITHADEETLIFGEELGNGNVGQYKWQSSFKRVRI